MEEKLMNEELKMLLNVVKRFVEKEVVAAEMEEGSLMKSIPADKVKQLQYQAKKMGLWALGVKEEFGGSGLDMFSRIVVVEEASKHRIGLSNPAAGAFGSDIPGFLNHTYNPTTQKFIQQAVQSGNGCYVAYEEEQNEGLSNIRTTAERTGDTWLINGEKKYVRNAAEADFGIVLANGITGTDQQGPSLFLIPAQNENIKKERVQLIHSVETHNVIFDQLELSDDYRVGDVGDGLRLMSHWMNEQQLLMSARCIGVAGKSLELALEWASTRITFGKRLKEREAIQCMIADSIMELNSARLMLWNGALKMSQSIQSDRDVHVQMAKLICTESAFQIIDRCIQIHGGMGVAQEVPLERWYKEIRAMRLETGSSNFIRKNVGKHFFEMI